MATYYKYAERDVNSQVDWGKIGADITNMLQEQARLKAAKEQAFEDQTQAMSKTLEDMPTGENQMLNEKYMDFVSNAQEYRLQQDRLVKGGLLDPRDYKRSRQRFSDDTARFFDLGKKAQEEYKIKADRMAKGTSSFMEQDMMIMVEGLGNLQNLSPVINAANGSVQIGRMVPGKDGVMQLDGNELMGVQEIENRIKFTKDKFDKDTYVTNKSNLLGEFITAKMIEANGGGGIHYVLTQMNKKEREDIDAALLAMGNEVIASPYDAASILGDWTGEEYHLETNKEKADKDPKAIYSYVDANGTLQVELTPDQEKDVRDYIKEQVLFTFADKNDIPRMSTKPYAPQPNSAQIANRNARQQKEATYALIRKAMGGDAQAMQALITQYRGTGFAMDAENNYLTLTRDGVDNPVDLSGNTVQGGAGMAAALGLDSEDYERWATQNNVEATPINSGNLSSQWGNVRVVTPTAQAPTFNVGANIDALNKARTFDLDGNEFQRTDKEAIRFSFENALQQIAGPYGIETEVDVDGTVTIDGEVIPNGIERADLVLKKIQQKYDARSSSEGDDIFDE